MKTRLVAFKKAFTNSGVKVNIPGSSYAPTTSPITINVDTVDATTVFKAGDTLVTSKQNVYGVISAVTGTTITLTGLERTLGDDYNLYYHPEQSFEMDLMEEPGIVVNYNWIDIKEPDKRKGSFSQTIKVPFSDRNNKFFENWFDVNLEDIVFNTDTKFQAAIYVDSVEQMNGFIQLKSIYLNARQYEIVIFGNTADFFTAIKDKKLKDAFIDNDIADEQLDHDLTVDNIINSWTTGLTTVGTNPVSGSGTSNDVMYPIIDYALTTHPLAEGMFVNQQSVTFAEVAYGDYSDPDDNWSEESFAAMGGTIANNLKPAIRLQRLLLILAQKAGYTIQSTFLGINQDGTVTDTQFFSRIFMTLANQYTRVKTYYSGLGFQVSMADEVLFATIYGDQESPDANSWRFCARELGFTNESSPNFDPQNTFDIDQSTIAGLDVQQNTMSLPATDEVAEGLGLPSNYGQSVMGIHAEFVISFPGSGGEDYPRWRSTSAGQWKEYYTPGYYNSRYMDVYFQYKINSGSWVNEQSWSFNITTVNDAGGTVPGGQTPLADWPLGYHNIPISVDFTLPYLTAGDEVDFRLRFSPPLVGGGNVIDSADYFLVHIHSGMIKTVNLGGIGYTNGTYGMQVVMAENMPDISQADFTKDLVNRFNLVVLADPNNDKNVVIEPYQDYINSGTTQYWTDKLDVSKEQVVKSTNDLQKKEYVFQDKKGAKDHMGERYEREKEYVYGYRKEEGGDFSEGEKETFSIFAPFITQGIMNQGPAPYEFSGQSELPVAICQWYQLNDSETFDREPITDGIPRLFYYSGTPIDISGISTITGEAYQWAIYNAIQSQGILGSEYTLTNNKFPLCTQYNLDNLDTGIVSTTKQLLWDYQSPWFGFPWFVSNPFGDNWTGHGYFNDYWSQYFNEIYNTESRLMECYLYLTPTDIEKFEAEAFKNPVYIKNTLWRILKIQNYLVGGNQSTKVTLLKVIENLVINCSAIPGTYNADGTITFVDAEDGTTEVAVTNQCCEDINPDWTFQQTSAVTGEGTCYWDLPSSGGGGLFVDAMLPTPGGFTGNDFVNMPLAMPIADNVNTIVHRANGNVTGQVTNTIFYAVTHGTAPSTLTYGGTHLAFRLRNATMAYLEVDLIGTIARGSSNLGSVGYFKYYTLLSKQSGIGVEHSGTSGGVQVRKIEGTNFPTTPTINLTNTNETTGEMQMVITSSSADYTISWVAKVQFLSQKLVGLNQEDVFPMGAMFQNKFLIQFQDNNLLIWN